MARSSHVVAARVLAACALAIVASVTTRVARASDEAAAEAPANDQRILLEVDAIEGLEPEALRTAIAAELEVDVALVAPGVIGRGTVSVKAQGPKRVVVSFVTPQKVVVRVVDLPAKKEHAIETIALIVGNLVRDEAGGLIDALKKAKTPPPPPPEKKAAPTSPRPTPTVVPQLIPPPGGCTSHVDAPIAGDFVPGLGSSTTARGRRAVRGASLNGLGGLSAGLRGFELAGVFNVKSSFMCGVQVAGVFNWVSGPVHGVQVSGAFNWALGPVRGVQVSGGLNLGGVVRGAQVSSVNLARSVYGAQIAPVNVAKEDVYGAQIGAVNVAGGEASVQIGVVNIARDGAAPIGLVSIYSKGTTHVSAFAHETGIGFFELLHGGRIVHNLYGIGTRIGPGGDRTVVAAGMGARLLREESITFDLDALCLWFRRDAADQYVTMQPMLRLVFGVQVAHGLAVVGGPTYSVLVSNDPEETPQAAIGSVTHGAWGEGWSARGWPGFTLGIRAL